MQTMLNASFFYFMLLAKRTFYEKKKKIKKNSKKNQIGLALVGYALLKFQNQAKFIKRFLLIFFLPLVIF